jgi:hypothetical protein
MSQSDPQSVMPSQPTHINGLVSDRQVLAETVQEISDLQPTSTSPISVQPSVPISQLESDSMSEQSSPSDSSPLASHFLPESPRETPPPDAFHPEETPEILELAHTSPFVVPPAVDTIAPLKSNSEDSFHIAGSNPRSEGPHASSSTREELKSCPLLIPLPESDIEEEDHPELARAEGARSSINSQSQTRGADMTSTNERRNTTSRPDVPSTVRPSKSLSSHQVALKVTHTVPGEFDDYQALWVLGDSVLERRDRRVHERWKAGLGVIFVMVRYPTGDH